MSMYIEALRSGWKAGLRQFRKRMTEMRKARTQADADAYQRDAIAGAQSPPEAGYEVNAAGTFNDRKTLPF